MEQWHRLEEASDLASVDIDIDIVETRSSWEAWESLNRPTKRINKSSANTAANVSNLDGEPSGNTFQSWVCAE